ncbi:hypothetical protein OPV22_009204 [Ensete ventricosum]|uniref:Uncharacterized protein n=1 Tax=Ensete ventricosum TaxID=4639 RepID=A0AAV8RCT2_ENSVE|nr:hypothetical protein OPV22_009204 [Ensete ventricosum]
MPTWTLAMVVTSLSHSTSYSTHSPRAIADKESEGISGKSTLRQLFKRIIDAHNGDAAKSDGYASPEHHVLKHDDFTLRGDAKDHLAFCLHLLHPCLYRSII